MDSPLYEMKMNQNVLNHLGINLYRNIPAVLSEIVANAWDADATKVHVKTVEDILIIKDNGCGMDINDINNKFLTVGYQKREKGKKCAFGYSI
ncbi:ATP-binding protein [Enterococcus casseliflavus]